MSKLKRIMIILMVVTVLMYQHQAVLKSIEAEQESIQIEVIQSVTEPVGINRSSEVRKSMYLDIPLSEELQWFSKNQSEYVGVPYELTIAVMDVESGFDPNAVSETKDFGIMQVNIGNQRRLESVFNYGHLDLLDIKDNIVCGTYYLGLAYSNTNGDLHKTLMVYNMGDKRAEELWSQGIYETEYSREVVKKYDAYRRATENSRR